MSHSGFSEMPPQAPEQIFAWEEIQKLIEEHEADFRRLVRASYQMAKQEGIYDTGSEWQTFSDSVLKYRVKHPYRGGKQQPVIILECMTPTHKTFEVVCKYDEDEMFKKQQEHSILQRLLPHIYLEEDNIAVIEKLDGLELGPYVAFIKEPEHMDQLVEDAFGILEEISQLSFHLNDANFVDGSNALYDTRKSRFRIFDIHAFQESAMGVQEKFLHFLNDKLASAQTITREDANFAERMLKKYLEVHPETALEFTGSIQKELADGDPGYEEELKSFYRQNPRFMVQGLRVPLRILEKGVVGLREDLKEACLAHDQEKFFELLQNRHYRTTRNPLLERKRAA